MTNRSAVFVHLRILASNKLDTATKKGAVIRAPACRRLWALLFARIGDATDGGVERE